MSKKPKYKAHPDAMNPGFWFVESPRDIICQRCTMTSARKIARALNAMEDKPKANPLANGVYEFTLAVKTGLGRKHAELSILSAFAKRDPDQCVFIVNHARRDSLQKRP